MKKAVIFAVCAALAAAIIVGGCFMFGLFDKKYVIGKNVSSDEITSVSVVSTGMSRYENRSYSAHRDGDEYYVVLDIIDEDVSYENERFDITRRQWNTLISKLEGTVCKKKTKSPFSSLTLDGGSTVMYVEFPALPDGYYAPAESGLLGDIASLIERMALTPDEHDAANIVEVEYGYCGDSLGAHGSTSLSKKDGKWTVVRETCAGNGCDTEKTSVEVSPELIKSVITILSEYDWDEFAALPPSEEFALDAAVHNLSFTFEPFSTWSIDSNMELTSEAREMRNRIIEVIDAALPE